ncbi:MAG: LysO family transporter [Fermentimonas sp.]|nr:LysO family transporter [Fermentimonas sp.]
MFIVIAFMFIGGILGYILRRRNTGYTSKVIMILICLLLLLLGIEVGQNPEIINGISTIGVEALTITIAAVAGSAIMSLLLWKYIKSRKK